MNSIKVTFNCVVRAEDLPKLHILSEGSTVNIKEVKAGKEHLYITLVNPYPIGKECYLLYGESSCLIELTDVVRTKAFDQLFYYDGEDLGAVYSENQTTFTCWAPTAIEARLVLYKNWFTEEKEIFSFRREDRGIWRFSLEGDRNLEWYHFEVLVNGAWNVAVDPYARFVSVNGERAMIGNMEETNPTHWPIALNNISKSETIIYELHIRDFTIGKNNGIRHKGLFLGLTENETVDKEGRETGLTYIRQLGVTHIELLPVNDYGSVDESNCWDSYNWGYDPIHYYAPEGSYATDPYNGYSRVNELKQLIAACHRQQLRVILDVVFNHIYIWELSHFEKLVPGYFFRHDENGNISNGTGVGNDLATERQMVQKYIVDCVCFWVKEYNIDGLRFDLMGILDVKTMQKVATAVERIKPGFFLLGEGWDLPTALAENKRATMRQAKELPTIGFFQDQFRDAIKGSTFHETNQGFCNGNGTVLSQIMGGVSGSEHLFLTPQQAIHYVESHDNHTLWDKLTLSLPGETNVLKKKRHRLATSIVLLAQGIPFLHAGQEFFRTKYGVENSYNSPDWINQFDWERRGKFEDTVEFVKGLISIRRSHRAFTFSTYSQINKHFKWIETSAHCVAYELHQVGEFGTWDRVVVIHNASIEKQGIRLPLEGDWKVLVDEHQASLIPLYTLYNAGSVKVAAFSTLVCVV